MTRAGRNEQRAAHSGLHRPWVEVADDILKAMGNFPGVFTIAMLMKSNIHFQDRLKGRTDGTLQSRVWGRYGVALRVLA